MPTSNRVPEWADRFIRSGVALGLGAVGTLLAIRGWGPDVMSDPVQRRALLSIAAPSLVFVLVLLPRSTPGWFRYVARVSVVVALPVATWSNAGRAYGLLTGIGLVVAQSALLDRWSPGAAGATGTGSAAMALAAVAAAQVVCLLGGAEAGLPLVVAGGVLLLVGAVRPALLAPLDRLVGAAAGWAAQVVRAARRSSRSAWAASMRSAARLRGGWRWASSAIVRAVDRGLGHPTARPGVSGIVIAACVGLVLRLAATTVNASVPLPADGRDPSRYVDLGRLIVDGQGMIEGGRLTTYWPPGYPAFVALWIRVQELLGVGSLRFWVGVGQSLLAAGAVLAVGLVVRRRVDAATGLVAAVLLAVWPNMVLGTATVMTEGLFTPLYAVGVVVLLWDPVPRWRALVMSSLLFGVATLTRPAGATAVVAAVVVASWTRRGRPRSAIAAAAVTATVFVAVLVPWLVYTQREVGTPVLSSFAGYNLCMGNSDGATGEFVPELCRPRPGESPEEADGRLRSEAIDWIVRHPERQPGLLARRAFETAIVDLHAVYDMPGPGYEGWLPLGVAVVVLQGWWIAALYLGARGGWEQRRDPFHRQALLMWGAVLVLPMLTIGDSRFHDAFVPFVAICVADRVVHLVRRSRSVANRTSGGPSAPVWSARPKAPVSQA